MFTLCKGSFSEASYVVLNATAAKVGALIEEAKVVKKTARRSCRGFLILVGLFQRC